VFSFAVEDTKKSWGSAEILLGALRSLDTLASSNSDHPSQKNFIALVKHYTIRLFEVSGSSACQYEILHIF
jgi:hypothetical protein